MARLASRIQAKPFEILHLPLSLVHLGAVQVDVFGQEHVVDGRVHLVALLLLVLLGLAFGLGGLCAGEFAVLLTLLRLGGGGRRGRRRRRGGRRGEVGHRRTPPVLLGLVQLLLSLPAGAPAVAPVLPRRLGGRERRRSLGRSAPRRFGVCGGGGGAVGQFDRHL